MGRSCRYNRSIRTLSKDLEKYDMSSDANQDRAADASDNGVGDGIQIESTSRKNTVSKQKTELYLAMQILKILLIE